ncbi:nitrate reductase molybdenum cofactor assembly chaperone [Bordetella genomosp. 11]|uniref:Nitrate reductase molybdenum cofactor assembly chaperone n=1 Tax=Bordetella genomosp. 11 TaxID=1416808 RepID=A0A261URD3_9BORD|nr:nitrate reductase molybdenum cofactor assembly chaperone [Bordetella genomosp. 11]OZI64458.1 nitrate reductase molybdenum cofactor assembly chaperone [Bordetella genomosp. 11]
MASSLPPSGTVYAALSVLLDYPGEDLRQALPELRACLDEARFLPRDVRAGLRRFMDYLAQRDLLTLQENYVALFDRGRATSLYLFEHVHGESRDRGQAMVDLMRMYEGQGMYLRNGELPDYLPVFLEYLSRLPPRDARDLLAETADILQSITAQLAKRGTHYSLVTAALLPLAGGEPAATPDQAHDDDAGDLPDAEHYGALDAAYADEPVRFVGAATPAAVPIRFHEKRPQR